jgi:hypothetical protein
MLFLDCEELNADVPRMSSRSICIYHVDGSLVIFIQQSRLRWRETKLDENGCWSSSLKPDDLQQIAWGFRDTCVALIRTDSFDKSQKK